MKKLTLLTLIGVTLFLSGCTIGNTTLNNNLGDNQVINKNTPEEKTNQNKTDYTYCEVNSDCKIFYQVYYKGQCSAGCFNKSIKADLEQCRNTVWESFPPNYTCACKNNVCNGAND
jgi:Tfp pilus assembly protein PilV